MNTPLTRSGLCRALLGLMLLSTAPLDAASFVYEGQLDDRGVPANGRYDIQLAVYRDAELGATLDCADRFQCGRSGRRALPAGLRRQGR